MQTKQATVTKLSNRLTVKDLAVEINTMKSDNTIQHNQMRDRMDSLQEELKSNKKWFDTRLDKLDNRIWAIVMLTLGSLLASILSMMVV
jgi:hypothetical protein